MEVKPCYDIVMDWLLEMYNTRACGPHECYTMDCNSTADNYDILLCCAFTMVTMITDVQHSLQPTQPYAVCI